ncbi:hypothetical protein [Parvularcula lutaonensis]|uniref:Outer membrane protein beta-barrel domain-containing protein n=1 Tax=Parvularcula lutaonensis TaxID=491923 RepID=A0ABV7MAJ7_9PROT|nr:hypothetical protein [Parvularcula lutaonensis]GGY38189.1 hypothetical protein GCM10007148_03090 [Parvularcula lutaonensis]
MKRLLLTAAASVAALSSSALAGIGADVSVGTPGVSGNVHYQVTPFVTLRGGANFFEFEMEDMEFDGISYDVDFGFTQLGGYVDLHPMMNGFTVTGGMLFGERQIELSATPVDPVEIGGQTFSASDVGSLVGSANFGDTSYYAGVGWDSTTHGLMPVSFVIRAGVLMTDSPEISLVNVGGSTDPIIQSQIDAEIATEINQLQSDFEDFEFYPMVSIGIGFGF